MWWLNKSEVSLFFLFAGSVFPLLSDTSFVPEPPLFDNTLFDNNDCREEHFLTNPNLLTFVILQIMDSSKSSFFFSSVLFSQSNRHYCFNHVRDPNILIVFSETQIIFVNLVPSVVQKFRYKFLCKPFWNLS